MNLDEQIGAIRTAMKVCDELGYPLIVERLDSVRRGLMEAKRIKKEKEQEKQCVLPL